MTGLVEGSRGWARDGDRDFGWRLCILWSGVDCRCFGEFHSSNVCGGITKSWNVVGGGGLVSLLRNQ